MTKTLVPEAIERFLEALAEEIADSEWVDTLGIGKVQVWRKVGKDFVTSIITVHHHVRRPVLM